MFVGGIPVAALQARRAQAALWTPGSLGSALIAWWDASQGVTLNGSTVSSWKDRVAALTASQATAANQPGFSATARNGKPGLTFGGSQALNFTPSAGFPVGTASSTIAVSSYGGSTATGHMMVYCNAATGPARAINNRSGFCACGNGGQDHQSTFNANGVDRFLLWQLNNSTYFSSLIADR